ncbi:MAG: hypothetical protein QNJ70_07830 [Xenococcaceae cyanobacterium MO_207.B15]|nr:hypothetical protein [Xenococcaceae cyanobacterium MO_207.B15]
MITEMKGPHGHKIDIEKELDRKFAAPNRMLGYISPSIGAFTLSQNNDPNTGHASFVWHHYEPHGGHSHFEVDWHDDPLEYVGGLINNEYWCYKVKEDPEPQEGPVYIAFAKEIMLDRKSGVNDEGYRIIYVDHGFVHLWAWDGKTFQGHEE